MTITGMKQQYGIAVKINIYKGSWVDEVVYYRYNQPLQLVERWRWYFEYLAALVKVHNPHRKVELVICSQDRVLCGEDYIREKTKTLLRAQKIKLKKTKQGYIEEDLFGFVKGERDNKISGIQEEIDALERGEFRYYVPPTEINNIKKWIKK